MKKKAAVFFLAFLLLLPMLPGAAASPEVGFFFGETWENRVKTDTFVYGEGIRAMANTNEAATLAVCYYEKSKTGYELISMETVSGTGILLQPASFLFAEKAGNRRICAFLFAKGGVEPLAPSAELLEWDPSGRENLVENGAFNTLLYGKPAGWSFSKDSWNKTISLCKEGKENTRCLELCIGDTSSAYAVRRIENIIGGSRYMLELDYSTVGTYGGEGARLKIEYYNAAGANFDSVQSGILPVTGGEWKHISMELPTSVGTADLRILLRLFGAGQVRYDNVALYLEEAAAPILTEGDTFFYTDLLSGTVGISVNKTVYVPSAGDTMTVSLRDGETILKQESGIGAENPYAFTFALSLLKNTGKKYTVRIQLQNKEGTVLCTQEKEVYRYDRPSMLSPDGTVIVSGAPFIPVLGYHVYEADSRIKAAKAAGVNVAVSGGSSAELGKQYLDNCQANGIMGTLMLYKGMRPAGSDENIDNTTAMVTALKDHPALFGYLVMDEPYVHSTDPLQELIRSYKTIRDLDSVHPVILQDSMLGDHTEDCAKMCDIYVVHSYPIHTTLMDTEGIAGTSTGVLDRVENVLENSWIATRPVYCLTQTFGSDTREEAEDSQSYYYMPTKEELRNQLYQCALHPVCRGTGFYSFKNGTSELTSKPIYTEMKAIAETELAFVTALLSKEYTLMEKEETGAHRWYTVLKEGKRYLIVLNMQNSTAEITVNTAQNFAAAPFGETASASEVTVRHGVRIRVPANGAGVYAEKT
ncbi:MAG: hypothetical protein E7390_01130 [Ruminococcaceae bacterium]|nr:hypothetical protein [Oscillospiraceae bacterium]